MSSAEEVTRLRDCLNDLVGITTLSAHWTDAEPSHIVTTLADALLGTLRLAFVVVRLNDPKGGPCIEATRVAESWQGTPRADCALASARLGLQGEIGILVAGSERLDFPIETDRLVLEVAANQATIALHQARVLGEQKRVASDLYERVARRTSELAAANEHVDSIPGLVAILTPAGEVDVVNHQLVYYCGQTLDAMKQWGTNGTVYSEDLPRVVEVFTQAITSGEPYDFEARIRRFDGVYRWFQVRGLPFRDSTGCIARWYVLLTDIDERKRAEEALRANELNFQLTVDSIPGMVHTMTATGGVEFVNQQILDFFGKTVEELNRWDMLLHPDDRSRVVDLWTRSVATGEPFDVETRALRADGTYRWFRSRALPLRDISGNIVRWQNLLTDIDERKRAEDALRQSERNLKLIIDTIPALAWSARPDGSAEFFSQYYLDFIGFPATQARDWGWTAAVHSDDAGGLAATWQRILASGAPGEAEARFRRYDGEYRWFLFRANPLRDEKGSIVKWYGVNTDITERKLAQEALNKAGAELAHVSRLTALSALTASIAHEVNQPLAGIITNAGTCLRLLDAEPPNIDGARETARRTIRDGNRASEVIARLRALFSKREFALEPLDLNEAAREVIALSSNDLQRNRVILHSELANDLPIVTGDRIQLQQVILNLLRNASDAMADVHDRPRQLVIKTERENADRVRLTVRDAGVGLSPRSVDSLFDAFYTTKSGGMGIGLFVSRSIVERHRGRLWAEPNDGPGATFSFSIPRVPARTSDAGDIARTA